MLLPDTQGRDSPVCKPLILLVGAGRFERPAPCAQGSRVASKGSIRCGLFLMFTTTWGICFSLRSKPKAVKGMGFGTVLAQSRGVQIAKVLNVRRIHRE
jgi:hypothetical protein